MPVPRGFIRAWCRRAILARGTRHSFAEGDGSSRLAGFSGAGGKVGRPDREIRGWSNRPGSGPGSESVLPITKYLFSEARRRIARSLADARGSLSARIRAKVAYEPRP